MKINNFLGYTDGIKEPKKTRIEKCLEKLYRSNGKIESAKTLIAGYIIKGYKPEKTLEKYTKRTGEAAEKTSYRLIKDRIFVELKKTEYDFACYLFENGLNTEEAMEKYEKEEAEKMKKIRIEKEEKERNEEEKRNAIEEEKRIVMEMIKREAMEITEEEKSLVNNVFMGLYDYTHPNNYTLIPLIKHAENKYCKEELKERLHNGNKGSIKVFELFTGVKLPKTHRDRKAFIDSFTYGKKTIATGNIENENDCVSKNIKAAREKAMERFILNAGNNELFKKPHYNNGKYVFVMNACLVETIEKPDMPIYSGGKTMNFNRILKLEPETEKVMIDIRDIIKRSREMGWNRKKNNYAVRLFGAVYSIRFIDIAFSIINDGSENAEMYLINGNDGKASVCIKTSIGSAVILPVYRGESGDYSDLIFVE